MIIGNVISEQKTNLEIQDVEKAKLLFSYLGFSELIHVKYHVIVYEKNGIEFAFQLVENLGTLIEYESKNDFDSKTPQEINTEKQKMFNELKNTGICISDETDVKKAYELIEKQLST